MLLDRGRFDALLFGQTLLTLLFTPPDLAQLVVMVKVGGQAEVEDGDSESEL